MAICGLLLSVNCLLNTGCVVLLRSCFRTVRRLRRWLSPDRIRESRPEISIYKFQLQELGRVGCTMLPRTTTFSRIWNLPPAAMEDLRRDFESAVGSVSGAAARACSSQPPLSVWESDAGLTVEVELPGVHESDLDVSVEDGVLTLSGTRKLSQHAGELKHSGTRHGEFSRSMKLHESLDPTSIQAELDNGVLTLSVSRRVEAQSRKIPVSVRGRTDASSESASVETPPE